MTAATEINMCVLKAVGLSLLLFGAALVSESARAPPKIY
jgi:hypothetical protein